MFAMAACAGIALVTVIDPYAGATAATYYQEPVMAAKSGVQRFDIDGGYVLVDVTRDGYKVGTASVAGGGDDTADDSGGATYTTPVGSAQTVAARLVASRGWAASEFTCLVNLWNRESGWNTHAANPSGAYGIPQSLPGSKMASAGPDWQNDAKTQILWGIGYIAARYGSPCGAWAHSNATGFY